MGASEMCGICGFVSKKTIDLSALRTMNDTMEYRGPDDSGEEIVSFSEKTWIGLAHRRLSILDLSQKGHQPFHSADGDVTVVFNGEIYNYRILKNELKLYPFLSECDTEVIVAAYKQWGIHFLEHIDGMFAIALFDREKRQLILARDRIGKKPLYYFFDGELLVFGSTLQPIMSFPGLKVEVNRDVLPRFLFNNYITGEDSILRNTYRVQPGEYVVFEPDGLKKDRYWDLVAAYALDRLNPIKAYPEAKERLLEALQESVSRRMVADVPVGAFLSGGYDSSLVVAVAQKLSAEPIKTFSIGFEEKEYDEAPYAEAVARYLGTEHVSHYVSEADMVKLVGEIPKYYDEPFADSSQIPSMLVAELAAKDVKVVLTGDGGDELFCGYQMYEKLLQAQRLEPAATMIRKLLGNQPAKYERFPFRVRAILQNRDPATKTQLGRESYKESIVKMLGCDASSLPYDESGIPEPNWQKRRMLLDAITYLPDNNLCKVDRASMRSSLEARNPLLDVQFVETSFRVPHGMKFCRGDKKHILKDLAYDRIPRELLDRPKKGFSVPIDKWMRGVLKEDLLSVTNEEYLREQGIFEPEFTSRYVREYLAAGDSGRFSGQNRSHIVWPLFMFQKWYQYYLAPRKT